MTTERPLRNATGVLRSPARTAAAVANISATNAQVEASDDMDFTLRSRGPLDPIHRSTDNLGPRAGRLASRDRIRGDTAWSRANHERERVVRLPGSRSRRSRHKPGRP